VVVVGVAKGRMEVKGWGSRQSYWRHLCGWASRTRRTSL
jgi:hypothetical protein